MGLVLALVVLATAVLLLKPARLDGHWRAIGSLTVGQLVQRNAFASHPGNLLSAARAHRVIRKGGGDPILVFIGGARTASSTQPQPFDDVTTRDGQDRIEPVRTFERLVDSPVHLIGTGSVEETVQAGSPGIETARAGAVSGDVISTSTVVPPAPTLIWRTDRFSGRKKIVALTFDDGPDPGQTDAILKILGTARIKATFFEIGENVEPFPYLSREVVASGMLLGNHTQKHPDLTRVPQATLVNELAEDQRVIRRATGMTPHWFRPPYGAVNGRVYRVAADMNLRTVLWSVDPNDWAIPPVDAIVSRVLSPMHPGAVVLMHDGGGDRSHTIAALPVIIRALKEQGYSFLRLDQFPGGHGSGAFAVQ